ncbi:MAG: DUF952 domain-containing protein [Spirochaetales bacterium]|nr:DUF952 domain-containing protein [Spirochaetales bacterium]
MKEENIKYDDNESIIYHLIPESDLRNMTQAEYFIPSGFEKDGFIHCTAEPEVARVVAHSYYSELDERLYILRLNLSALESEVKFEAPSQNGDTGKEHLKMTDAFPHIYGPMNISAVIDAGEMVASEAGGGRKEFSWPEAFKPL